MIFRFSQLISEGGTPRYLSLVVLLRKVGDEAVHKELGDRMERDATTVSSSEAEKVMYQDTILGDVDAQTRFKTTSKQSNDPPVSKVNTFRSVEDSMKILELMEFVHNCLHCIIMSSPKFAETHNVVAFLEKLAKSDGFAEIIDFLKASSEGQDGYGVVRLQAIDKKESHHRGRIRNDLSLDVQKRKEAKTAHAATEEEEHFNTPSNDPLPSGEDSMQLNELMALCTQLQQQVLDLEKAKSDQAIKIASLKKRVDKLEKRRQLRTTGLTRFKKLDAEVTLVNEQQNEDLMFDTGVLDDDEVFVDVASSEKNEQSTKLNDSTTSEAVTTASVEDSAAYITKRRCLEEIEQETANNQRIIKGNKSGAKTKCYDEVEEVSEDDEGELLKIWEKHNDSRLKDEFESVFREIYKVMFETRQQQVMSGECYRIQVTFGTLIDSSGVNFVSAAGYKDTMLLTYNCLETDPVKKIKTGKNIKRVWKTEYL
ncbi:hypothetical protein Tco_0295823 [Tanacetum coccineum]